MPRVMVRIIHRIIEKSISGTQERESPVSLTTLARLLVRADSVWRYNLSMSGQQMCLPGMETCDRPQSGAAAALHITVPGCLMSLASNRKKYVLFFWGCGA